LAFLHSIVANTCAIHIAFEYAGIFVTVFTEQKTKGKRQRTNCWSCFTFRKSRKSRYRKDDRAMRPYMNALKIVCKRKISRR